MPILPLQAAGMIVADCSSDIVPAIPSADGAAPSGCLVSFAPQASSKATEIIGGASALEAIRAQQATVPASHPLFSSAPPRKFEPAAAPAPRAPSGCAIGSSPFVAAGGLDFAVPGLATRPMRQPLFAAAPRKDLVLGSRMVPIARTSFDAEWRRVGASRSNLSATLARVGADGGRTGLVASVNRWVNREIAHAEDIELFGKSDYWADAATTLRLGKGDCEDFALLKMELLAAAGVAREDMVLTLARDLIRRRDHAVLLVKDGDGWLMLDNVGSAPLDASQSHGYRPVMSLGAKQSWLHGY